MNHEEGNLRRRGELGFTLIELLIVMIILGLLAALVAPKMFQKVGSSKQKAAKTQISMLGTALDAYRLDMGRYPSGEDGLDALRKPPGQGSWDGPYLSKDVPPTHGETHTFTGLQASTVTMIWSRWEPTARTVGKAKMPMWSAGSRPVRGRGSIWGQSALRSRVVVRKVHGEGGASLG